ncbi:MAG: transglutaminase domain-containing protein [Flavobacterium sp.]|uniref:transglutaminase domain-containing protein n=1 Tax=Flavobacterium sp. TaxID=239 RepID=UPI0032654125
MKIILMFSIMLLSQLGIGQTSPNYSYVDNKMLSIPGNLTTTTTDIAGYINSNFTSQDEKMRAIYYWVTANISYDVPNMYQPNNLDSPEVKIANTLKTRKGVCIHYAEVFNDIAIKAGVKSYIVGGYTKQFDEVANISHAWNISQIDGKWFLFDATWGAGSIDGKIFTKKQNNTYFKRAPDRMIVNHMPFDYLWQLLSEPLTNDEFISGKSDPAKPKINFDFNAEIEKYEKISDADKAFEASKRIEKNGLSNKIIKEYYNSKKSEFTAINQNKSVEKLVVISANFNEAISYLNDFIMFRNKRFKPTQSDETLKKMMQDVSDRMKKCNDDVYNVGPVSPENAANVNGLKRAILAGIEKTKEQEKFLKEYLSKGSLGRKMMFTNFK